MSLNIVSDHPAGASISIAANIITADFDPEDLAIEVDWTFDPEGPCRVRH